MFTFLFIFACVATPYIGLLIVRSIILDIKGRSDMTGVTFFDKSWQL